jgi:SAM-dependent methyltransferase
VQPPPAGVPFGYSLGVFGIIQVGLAVVLAIWIFAQVRKPSGPLGRWMIRGMNQAHATMSDWALEQLPIGERAAILDVGCGGGRTVQRLAARAAQGTVCGIDYSAASVATSRATNAREVESGRVRIVLGSVAALPFGDQAFDLVTAVETHYYWPDLPANTREVLRTLKPGGTFALIAETHRDGWLGALYALPMRLMRAAHLSAAEHRELLTRAGFTDVTTLHRPGKNWICATGRRPFVPLRPVRDTGLRPA